MTQLVGQPVERLARDSLEARQTEQSRDGQHHAGHGRQWQADPARLLSLRNARLFDTVWFDSAYELGLAMAQADSMLK